MGRISDKIIHLLGGYTNKEVNGVKYKYKLV